MLKNNRKNKIIPYIFLLPTVIIIIAVFFYPLLLTFKNSFFDVSMLSSESKFVGLENFKLLLSNKEFIKSIKTTILWTLSSLSLKIIIGLVLALLLNKNLKGVKIYRVLVLLSWAMPQVTSGIIWTWIFDGSYGHLNYFLTKLGFLQENLLWLGDKKLAFLSTVVVDAWMGIPFITLMILSALQAIPESLYEAAELDGANRFNKFRLITIPQIRHIVMTAITLTSIWTFNAFNAIWVLTKGGPLDATETLAVKIYNEAFVRYNTSLGCTMSVIVFLILSLITIIYWKKFLGVASES